MDESTWVWMYQSWLQDQDEKQSMYKNLAIFLGSFFNWDMANQISKQDNPDYESSDKDYEEAFEKVRYIGEMQERFEEMKSKRHRRVVG